MSYKMTLLPLPRGSVRDRKRVSEHDFQTSEYNTPKTEYELNHALECQTLSMIKSHVKRDFWKKIMRKSNYMKVYTIESRKHAS